MRKFISFLTIILLPFTILPQGSLLLVGGGREDYNGWSDEPYGWFVQQADSGKIVNIDVDEASDWYSGYFGVLGADDSSHKLRIATRDAANDSDIYNQLVTARGIFIEGGDQWEYVETWKGTLVEDAIHAVFQSGGTIGGTSAGLAILGEVAFDAKYGTAYPDYAAYDPYYNRIHFEDDFLDILPGVLTDTHFQERGRLGRLVPMLARRIIDYGDTDIVGIGVDAQSVFCIGPDLVGTAYGGTVTILYQSDNSYIDVAHDQPVTFTNMHFDQLLSGAKYNLHNRSLIETGPNITDVTPTVSTDQYTGIQLNGSDTAIAHYGEKIVNGVYSDTDAWLESGLSFSDGTGQVPGTVIMPKLWNLDPQEGDNYFPNRIAGAQYGVAANPGLTAIYLDDHSTANISTGGVLESDTLVYVLDTRQVTHAGVLGNLSGMINARLHFLGPGSTYNLQNGEPLVGVKINDRKTPESTQLIRNYPNPFNGETRIEYYVFREGIVQIEIFNTAGQYITTLANERCKPGNYSKNWIPTCISSGVYYIRMLVNSELIDTNKILYIK